MNRFYQILNWISTGGNTASRPSLLKHFSGELIDECLDNGYLVEIRRNALKHFFGFQQDIHYQDTRQSAPLRSVLTDSDDLQYYHP